MSEFNSNLDLQEGSEEQHESIHKKVNGALNGKKGNSILSLAGGIVSLVLSFFTISIFGLAVAIGSLGAGIAALVHKEANKGIAIAGIVISSISLIIYVGAFVINLL